MRGYRRCAERSRWGAGTLALGAIPAASQFVVPIEAYLAQWPKVVGGLVWFTAAWAGWRVIEPAVRAVPRRRVAAAVVGVVAVVGTTAWSWSDAAEVEPRFTIAVHDGGAYNDPYAECERSPTTELVASWDPLTPEERAFVDDMRLRRLDPDGVSADDLARADRLERAGTRVGVFTSP